MFYVYVIRSVIYKDQIYIGYTSDLKKRLVTHNHGGSVHTAKYKPWELIVYFGFPSRETALRCEKYLKTQSGRLFLKKRLF